MYLFENYLIPVAQGWPGDGLLTVTIDAEPAPHQSVRSCVIDLHVIEKSGALIEIQSDQACLREVGDLVTVGSVVVPAV